MNFSIEEVGTQGDFVVITLTFDKEVLLQDEDFLTDMVEKFLKKALDPEDLDW